MVNNKEASRAEQPASVSDSDSDKKKKFNRNKKGKRGNGENLKVDEADTEASSTEETAQMKKLSREFWSLNQAAEVSMCWAENRVSGIFLFLLPGRTPATERTGQPPHTETQAGRGEADRGRGQPQGGEAAMRKGGAGGGAGPH